MESVLALRQPLSDPTWANPMTAPLRTAGSTWGSSPPAAADASPDAAALLATAVSEAAAALVLDVLVLALLPHAARASAATAAAAKTANFLVTTSVPPTLDEPGRKGPDRRCGGRLARPPLRTTTAGLPRCSTHWGDGPQGRQWPSFRSRALLDKGGGPDPLR